MKEKAAAIGVLVYAFLLFGWVCWGAVLGGSFNLMTIPVYAVMFIGPAIGIYRRRNWCRKLLGAFCAFVFVLFIVMPLQSDEFHFRLAYLVYLVATGLPVYVLLFWRPLKRYTMNEGEPNKAPEPTPGSVTPRATERDPKR
jgi:hypothetical protein